MRILIVDDRETNRKVLRVLLQAEGIETAEAEDGAHALEMLATMPVDCVVSDILMPNLDGYALCKKIRSDANLRNLPILIYTSTRLGPDEEKVALGMGADRYLKKPARSGDILSAIKEISTSGRRSAPPRTPADESEVLKRYSELLIKKLEEQNLELQERTEKLQESEAKLKQLVESDYQVFFLYDAVTGDALYVSPAYETIWGKTCESLYQSPQSWMESVHPEDIDGVRSEAAKAGHSGIQIEYRVLRPDGSIRWMLARTALLKDGAGNPRHFCGIALDVTDRKVFERRAAAEHAVAMALSVVPAIKDAAPRIVEAICKALDWEVGAVWRRDPRHETLKCLGYWQSPEIEDLKFQEITGKAAFARGEGLPGRVWEKGNPVFLQDIHDALGWSTCPRISEGLRVGLHGAFAIPLNLDNKFMGVLEFFSRNIRPPDENILRMLETVASQVSQYIQRREAADLLQQSEMQFRQAQKLEAVGRLAGGVAHDFNNLLTAIMGYSELMLPSFKKDDSRREDILEIKKTADRAAALTRQLLAFSRKQILQPKNLELNAVVADAGKMLRRLIGEDIQLNILLKSNSGIVYADPGQIEQVLVNLIVNCRDAMPEGGKITVETEDVTVSKANGNGPEPGAYALLAVTDTGCGMSQEVLGRLFEPFFTTKEKGKGTGLGLSTVYGIVKQSKGHIAVYSEPGVGSAFKIYLPRAQGQAQPHQSASPQERLQKGEETILLVEDETVVRRLASRILSQCGYRVLEAHDGKAAIDLACGHMDTIHLVLTDVIMPKMSGKALVGEIAKIHPEAKVLYTSGYTDDSIVHHGILDPGINFIGKPFSPEAISAKVRQVLDATGDS